MRVPTGIQWNDGLSLCPLAGAASLARLSPVQKQFACKMLLDLYFSDASLTLIIYPVQCKGCGGKGRIGPP
jgi:hypothetical protein